MKKYSISKKHIFIFFAVILIILGSVFQQQNINKKVLDRYNFFNKNNIIGILNSFRVATGEAHIRVKNIEYIFLYKSGENISYIAKKGDSIIKPAFSDTIILKKLNGETYKFTFNKPKQ